MGKYILVDTENVNLNCLKGIEKLTCYDRVFLFLSEVSKRHYTNEKIDNFITAAEIQKINVASGTKNSLDFQLVSVLGLLIGEHKHLKLSNEYYIVSKDKGFVSSINLLNGYTNKVNINLVSNLMNIFAFSKLQIEEMLYKDLRTIFRGKTVKKILTAINDSECEDLLDIEIELLKTFNNPSVYKESEDIFKKYYGNINIVA